MTTTPAVEPVGMPRTPHSRSLLVTFLGAVVRRLGDWMPIAGAVELLTRSGSDEASVRTAVHRLKTRGWLESSTYRGARGYRLTPLALGVLAEGDELIWEGRRPADLAEGWCIIHVSVPETARHQRYQLRAHLSSLGFGNVGTALWIAPARMRHTATAAIGELGVPAQCTVFVGEHVGGQEMPALLRAGWDLEEIGAAYSAFTARYAPVVARFGHAGATEPEEAFTTFLDAVNHWRRLPFRDPGLPLELMPRQWGGPAAVAVFQRLVAELEGQALAYAAGYWPAG